MKSYKKELGEKIKYYRQKLGLTIEELSYRANLSISFIGEIERGRKVCSINTLYKIAKVLNVTIVNLFEFNKDAEKEDKLLIREIGQLITSLSKEDKKLIIRMLRLLINRLKDNK